MKKITRIPHHNKGFGLKKVLTNVRAKRKYWYDITIWECALCGASNEYHERKYGRKPSAQKRYHYEQFACWAHFL